MTVGPSTSIVLVLVFLNVACRSPPENMGMEKSPESRLRVADELLGLELPDPLLEREARRRDSHGGRET